VWFLKSVVCSISSIWVVQNSLSCCC
jgi:hypothetical protein